MYESNMSQEFSVLISVYYKENPIFLDKALSSIENQTLLPGEIVLVKDGLLSPELDEIITKHVQLSEVSYNIIALEKNVGLGVALDKGLRACRYEWVARMDGDDISTPDRFEKQVTYLETHPNIDVLGSWISEFSTGPDSPENFRKPPQKHDVIYKYATYTSPVNHMSVFYRKKAVLDAGSYQPVNTLEDYHLWIRMLVGGSTFANVPEILIQARTGDNMILRRHGWRYFYNEVKLAQAAYGLGFLSRFQQARNFFYRALPRLMPLFILKRLYTLARKFTKK